MEQSSRPSQRPPRVPVINGGVVAAHYPVAVVATVVKTIHKFHPLLVV